MPVDELRQAVKGLMPRAKEDLAELVAFKSVADPKQFPAEECEKAAKWVVDAFAARRVLQDVACRMTPDGSHGRVRPRARARGRADRAALQPLRRPAAAGRGGVDSPVFELTERDGRWYGRGAADCKGNIVMHLTALRALGRSTAASRAASSSSARAPRSRAPAGSRSSCPRTSSCCAADAILVVDTGNFAVGVPTLTTTLRGMRASSSRSRRCAARCTRACSAARRRTRSSR